MVYKWTFLTNKLSYLQVSPPIRTLNFIDMGYYWKKQMPIYRSHHILNFQIPFFVYQQLYKQWNENNSFIWFRDIQTLDIGDFPGSG